MRIRKIQNVVNRKDKGMKERRLPKEGSAETLYSRLKEYIIPVDPDWEKKLKPAKQEDIERIYSISKMKENGYKLPASYLEYLKYMGENDGGSLSYGMYANTDLTTIFLDYEEIKEEEFEWIEPNQYVFAFNLDVGVEYYITTKEDGRQVITSENDGNYKMEYYSESFEKFLFQTVYNVYERRYFEYGYYFGTNKITLDKRLDVLGVEDIFVVVDEMARKYGFTKVWFSDDYHYIAEKDNISFCIRKELAICGYVVGDDEGEVEMYGNILNELLGTHKQ